MPADAVLGSLTGATALAGAAWAVGRWAGRPAVAHGCWLLVLVKLVMPAVVLVPVLPPLDTNGWGWPLAGVWAAGAAVTLAVAVRRARRFHTLLRFATPAPPAVRGEVADLSVRLGLRHPPAVRLLAAPVAPLVWGVWRPTVYLPAGLLSRLSVEHLRPVLGHELAHVRRADPLLRWIECGLGAAAWWCPLAWLARRELRRHEEAAADAAVASVLPDSGHAYATAVLETADFVAGPATGGSNAADLRRRLEGLIDPVPPKPLGRPARTGLIVVAGAALLVGPGPRPVPPAVADSPLSPPPVRPAPAGAPPGPPAADPGRYRPEPTRLFAGGPVTSAAVAGDRLAVADGDAVRVFDVAGGRGPLTLAAGVGPVRAVALSADGRTLAVAGDGAAVWDVEAGRRLPLTGHTGWVTAVAVAPDGRTVVTGGYDRTVRVWDAATGVPRAAWVGHAGGVTAVAFAPDGRTVATGGADHEVRLWDAATGQALHVWADHEAAVRAVAFAPDGKTLATAADDGTVRLWRTGDGRPAGPAVDLPDDPPTSLGFAADGLFAGTAAGRLLALHPTTGAVRAEVGRGHAAAVTAVLRQGGGMITAALDGVVQRWEVGPLPAAAARLAVGGPVTAVAVSADGRTLAAGGVDGTIRLWDAATGAGRGTLAGHPGGVTALQFAGGRLVSAGADEQVRVWDPAAGEVVRTIPQATADLRLAVSADNTLVAVGSPARPEVVVWHLGQAKPVLRLDGPWHAVSALAFAPAGDTLAVGHPCGGVRLWEVGTGSELARWAAGGPVTGLAFEPDGRTLAAAVATDPPAAAVRFWDVRAAAERADRPPLRHPAPVSALAFAAGRVLTAGRDGDLRVWDAATGTAVARVPAHAGEVVGLAVGPDRSVYSAGDAAVKRWTPDASASAREGRP